MKRSPGRQVKKPQKVVSDVRSPHGTRVLKRIVCSRCGKSDTLQFVPRADEAPLCQACASEQHNVISENDSQSGDKYVACKSCGTKFAVAKRPREVFVPKGLEGMEDLLTPKDATDHCLDCRKKLAIERRNLAKKPAGVHPLIVKGKRTKA